MASEHAAHGAMGAAATELQEFTLDPPISPPRVLPGRANDQLLTLRALAGSATTWPPSIQSPFPAYQLSVRAQQGLRADQEGPPGRAGEDAAEGAENQAVGGLEARPADLASEDAELVAQSENIDLECGFGLLGEGEGIEQVADGGAEDTQNHGVGSCRACPG